MEIGRTPGSMQIWTGNKMNEALLVARGLEPKCLKCVYPLYIDLHLPLSSENYPKVSISICKSQYFFLGGGVSKLT